MDRVQENMRNFDECENNIENHTELQTLGMNMLSTLYLTLETKYNLSNDSLQVLISALSDISKVNTQHIISSLRSKTTNNIDENTEGIIEKDLFFLANNPSDGILRSNFSRKKYFEKKLKYIDPVKIEIVKDNKKTFFTMYQS